MFDRDEQEISQIVETGLEAILLGRTATLEQAAGGSTRSRRRCSGPSWRGRCG